jgi:hypothetical protein
MAFFIEGTFGWGGMPYAFQVSSPALLPMSKADTFHYWVAKGDLTPQPETDIEDFASNSFEATGERTPYQYGESDIPDVVSTASPPPSYDSSDDEYFSRTPYQDSSRASSSADSVPLDNSHDAYIDWLSNGCPDSDTEYIPDSD